MSDPYWLTKARMERLQPYDPKSHGKPRVDDGQVFSGIVFVYRNGLQWRDAPIRVWSGKSCPEQLCSVTAILAKRIVEQITRGRPIVRLVNTLARVDHGVLV